MRNDCTTILAVRDRRKSGTDLPGMYLGVIIIINTAVSVAPLELFVLELWNVHGYRSLFLIFLPLVSACLIAQSLPDSYYRTKRFESSGRLYEALGIRWFKRFTPDGDCINRINRRFDPEYSLLRSHESIVEFEARTRLAERCHLISLIIVMPSAFYALALGWNQFVVWLLLPAIPLHLYPVMLQRYTRARIERVLQRGGTV
jgi:glycosyl-4,4'-diaponeurosporenoate acyltransferase